MMDWDIDRVRSSKAWTHQKARQNANLERIVLKARCAVCDARLIKTQVYVTKEAAKKLRPHISDSYDVDQVCADRK